MTALADWRGRGVKLSRSQLWDDAKIRLREENLRLQTSICGHGVPIRDDARKVLAWEDIADEEADLRLDDGQKRQPAESLKKVQREIKETVWRTYKNVMFLGKD